MSDCVITIARCQIVINFKGVYLSILLNSNSSLIQALS